jgi:hypothetical protein
MESAGALIDLYGVAQGIKGPLINGFADGDSARFGVDTEHTQTTGDSRNRTAATAAVVEGLSPEAAFFKYAR